MMNASVKQNAIKSSFGLLAALLLFFSAGRTLPVMDAKADQYFREAITKAGAAYATCRVVNASVSFIKESEIQLEPAGIGISLAAGQLLDPIDDMTERLSDVLVTAITALGVQKLSYEICVSLAPPLLATLALVLSFLLWFRNKRVEQVKSLTVKVLLIIVAARLCLPLSSAANAYIHTHFFASQISAASAQLSLVSSRVDKLKDFSLPEVNGIFGTIENSASFLKQKTIAFNHAIETIVSHMGDIIENLLTLAFVFVAVFLIQVIILPLLSFWFLARVASSLFEANIPAVLNRAPKRKPLEGRPNAA